MVIFNCKGQVLWAQRRGQHFWQFPQGGIKENESCEEALFRELYEELGLTDKDVYIVQTSSKKYCYRVPKSMRSLRGNNNYMGQKQLWFLLTFTDGSDGKDIVFNRQSRPEFENWSWVSYWYPLRQVIAFKRDVYRKVLTEFAPAALQLHFNPMYSRKK